MLAWQLQEEEEQHQQQLGALKVAQEGLQGRLRQEEEGKTAAEQEVARQKRCISSLRADIAELDVALRQATSQVVFKDTCLVETKITAG